MADSNYDPEITAAFGGGSTDAPPSPSASYDPEITEAFKDSPSQKKSTTTGNSFLRHARDQNDDIGALSDTAITSVLNAPHKAWEGIKDLFSGGITKTEGPAKLENSSKETLSPGVYGQAAISKVKQADRALEEASPTAHDVLHQTGRVLGDVGDIANVTAPVLSYGPGLARSVAKSSLFDTAASPALSTAEGAQAAASGAVASRSGGAAGAAVDATTLKPDTQAELARGHSAGQSADPDALERIKKAESVGVDLTAGQARQDTGQMADEFNRKSESKNAVGNRFDTQDDALVQKVKDEHAAQAPSAVGNSEIQNGQAVINGVRRYDAPKVKEIDDAYSAARTANSGSLELDASGFNDAVNSGLKPQGKSKFLPSDVQSIVKEIGEFKDGRVPMDDFEGYRTQLSNASSEAKAAGKPNSVQAIKIVRDNLEKLNPTSDASTEAKGLFDKARSLHKARMDEIDANPAYDAVVSDPSYNPRKPETIEAPSDLADRFVSKYTGAQQPTVRLRQMLKGDVDANDAITSEAFRPLRKAAEQGKGFGSKEFDAAMTRINSRPELINNRDSIETLNNVNDVGKWTRLQRRGGTFNNSGTASVLLNAAGKGAEYVPGLTGTAARAGVNLLANRSAKNSIGDMLKPGAGLFKN